MQRYINTKPNSRSTAVTHDQNPTQKLSIEFYKIPSKDMQIIFIDSMSGYERLLDRLFKVNNEDQELFIGFDCMLFYSILSSITYPEIWRGEQISFRRCGRFPLEMYDLL